MQGDVMFEFYCLFNTFSWLSQFFPRHQSVINQNCYCQSLKKQKHGSNLIIKSSFRETLVHIFLSKLHSFFACWEQQKLERVVSNDFNLFATSRTSFLLLARFLVSTGRPTICLCFLWHHTTVWSVLVLVVQPEDKKWDAAWLLQRCLSYTNKAVCF